MHSAKIELTFLPEGQERAIKVEANSLEKALQLAQELYPNFKKEMITRIKTY